MEADPICFPYLTWNNIVQFSTKIGNKLKLPKLRKHLSPNSRNWEKPLPQSSTGSNNTVRTFSSFSFLCNTLSLFQIAEKHYKYHMLDASNDRNKGQETPAPQWIRIGKAFNDKVYKWNCKEILNFFKKESKWKK